MGIVTTPKYKLRAPDDTELVRNGASALRDLASDVEAALTVGVLRTRAGVTKVTTDTFGAATITLPAGVFTAIPVVVVSNATWGVARPFHVEVVTTTVTSVGIVIKPDSTNAAVPVGNKAVDVNWIAVQP